MAAESVLIIEPMRRDATTLAEGVLAPEGYTVRHALDETHGLRMALEDTPDLIIADLAAARKLEPDLITRLRQAGHDIPVILTSYSIEGVVYRWAFEMRAMDLLGKPLDLETARKAVRRALGSRPVTEEARGQPNWRVGELRKVHELARAVTSVDELDVVLRRVVDAAISLTRANEGCILLLEDRGVLYVRAAQGTRQQLPEKSRIKAADSVAWRVIRTGAPVLIKGAGGEDGLEISSGYRVDNLLHVPLKQRGDVIGALCVHNRVEGDFAGHDAQLLAVLADQASAAIAHVDCRAQVADEIARLSELAESGGAADKGAKAQADTAMTHRVKGLRCLQDFTRSVSALHDPDQILDQVVEVAIDITGAEEGYLLLLDKDGKELYVRTACGLGQELATGFRIKSKDSVVWKVVQSGKPTIVTSPVDSAGVKSGQRVRSMLHVPIRADGTVIGVLSVHHKNSQQSLTEDDQSLLSLLVDCATVSIDNALRFGRTESDLADLSSQLPDVEKGGTEFEERATSPAVPVAQLVDELQAQRAAAEEGRREVERLTQAVASQLAVLQQVTDAWHSQQTAAEQLARQTATPDDAAVDSGRKSAVITLSDLGEPLDHVGTGLVLTDSQGIVTQANGAARGILHAEELVGQPLHKLSSSARWLDRTDQFAEAEAPADGGWDEITFWHQGRLIKALFLPGSGVDQGRTVILRDLVRDRGVRLAMDDVKEAVFMELRTPLTILSNHTELLLGGSQGELTPGQKRALGQMRESIGLISQHLEKPVALPGLADEQKVTYPSADLGSAIHKALESIEEWRSEKPVTVEPELPEQLPRVAAQADCVHEMVVDLLKNAVQATPAGGTVRLFVASGMEHDGETRRPHVLLSVTDQGGGIPADRLGQVFQQLPSEETQPITGLGGSGQELVQVRTLVEAFGGRVWAETEPGSGTTFSFVLPAVLG